MALSKEAYENKKKYVVRWRKERTKELTLRLMKDIDEDIIAKLDSLEGVTKIDYIRNLIRADIKNSK